MDTWRRGRIKIRNCSQRTIDSKTYCLSLHCAGGCDGQCRQRSDSSCCFANAFADQSDHVATLGPEWPEWTGAVGCDWACQHSIRFDHELFVDQKRRRPQLQRRQPVVAVPTIVEWRATTVWPRTGPRRCTRRCVQSFASAGDIRNRRSNHRRANSFDLDWTVLD